MNYKNNILLFLSLAIIATTCPITVQSAIPIPELTVEQRTDILPQERGGNLCGYHSLWNIHADQTGKAIAYKSNFTRFKNRYQHLCNTSPTLLNEAELWRIIGRANIPNTIIIPNGDFLSGDLDTACTSLQAAYTWDGHNYYLTTALRNYNAGQKIYCVINPRHVSLGESGNENGAGHWFVIAIQKTATGNHATIFESLSVGEEDIELDALIAQKLADGCEDIEQARKEAEAELAEKKEEPAEAAEDDGVGVFVDRRRSWPEELVDLITLLSLTTDLTLEHPAPVVADAPAAAEAPISSRKGRKRRPSTSSTTPASATQHSPTASPKRKRARSKTASPATHSEPVSTAPQLAPANENSWCVIS